jgi:hypothetical protein
VPPSSREIDTVPYDGQGLVASVGAVDPTLGELIGDREPENCVIRIRRIVRRRWFGRAEIFEQPVRRERQARDRLHGTAHIQRKIARIKPAAPHTHADASHSGDGDLLARCTQPSLVSQSLRFGFCNSFFVMARRPAP